MKKAKQSWIPLNLAELIYTSSEKYAGNEALKYRVGHHYESLTYNELKEEIVKLAQVLRDLGIKPKDKAIVFSENRPEWVITDLALVTLGVVNVPIHNVLSAQQLATIIKEIKPKVLFFSNRDLALKILEIAPIIADIPQLISYEKIPLKGLSRVKYFKQLIDEVEVGQDEQAGLIETALKIKPDDIATIIYTSGTTGHFKGVQLTHRNFIFDLTCILKYVQVTENDRFFSILPLSHVFERTVGYYIPLYCGASIGYATDLTKISEEIRERKPTIVIAVPRLFEKIYEKIINKVNASPVKKIIFKIAFTLRDKSKNKQLQELADKLVFAKIRSEFGGEIRFFVSGGAALSPKLGKFFRQVGMIILEGYGLTETAPVVACNRLEDFSFGTVGPVLEGVKVKIGDSSEVLIKGGNVTPGYLRASDTREAFTKDGWFKSGDFGYFDKKGFLVISGRKKDLIVLSTGKKVSPTIIEECLESSLYIEQAYVFGDGRKHIGAVIVPSFDKLRETFPGKNHQLAKNERVRKFLIEEISRLLKHLAHYESVEKFIIQAEPFTIESGELTPKLSLRRHVIYERNAEEIEKIYKP